MRFKLPQSFKMLTLIGVISAGVIAVNANILVHRFYTRWDWTSSGLYTLSDATRQTLRSLEQPLDVVVFLSKSDPAAVGVRHMLTAYGAETTQLRPRYVDPDRDPAEFSALQRKYNLLAGTTEDGRLVTDAALVIARGDRHWFITQDDIVTYDDQAGRARPRLEQALTEGIRNVLERDKAVVCFTNGHREISTDEGGPTGLGELSFRLQKNNYTVKSVNLAPPIGKAPLSGCDVVAVIGPEISFDARAAELVSSYLEDGGNVLVLSNPILDDDNRIRPTGLDPVALAGGIRFGNDLVIEGDTGARLPSGVGETYFSVPKEHEITKGLLRGGEPDFKLLVSTAQSLMALDDASTKRVALLETSNQAFSLKDIRRFMDAGEVPSAEQADKKGPFALAYAVELGGAANPKQRERRGSRLVVGGSANLAWSRNWREPTLLGNRLFMESAVAWLAAQPPLVSVPEKASTPIGLSLTEESLGEVWRYVLLYMPGAAVVLGIYVLLRRRSVERKSRRAATEPVSRSSDALEQGEKDGREP